MFCLFLYELVDSVLYLEYRQALLAFQLAVDRLHDWGMKDMVLVDIGHCYLSWAYNNSRLDIVVVGVGIHSFEEDILDLHPFEAHHSSKPLVVAAVVGMDLMNKAAVGIVCSKDYSSVDSLPYERYLWVALAV